MAREAVPEHSEDFLDGVLRDDDHDASCHPEREELTFIPSVQKSLEDRVRVKRDPRTVHSIGAP